MPVNREQMHMEQSQTVDNEVYTVGDMVYYTGTGLTFENGDRLEHGEQGEVTGPATSKRTGGRGLAVKFPGNEGALDCCFTEARRLPPLSSLRCPSCPPPKAHNNIWRTDAQVSHDPPAAPLPGGYAVGDTVYYTVTGKTPFENGDVIQYGSQGKVEGPVNGEELNGEGVAVLFSGNKCMDDCLLTQARRLPPPTTPRGPS